MVTNDDYECRMERTVSHILNPLTRRKESDPAILAAQQRLSDILASTKRSKTAIDEINILLERFFDIRIIPHPSNTPHQPSIAVFQNWIGSIKNYIKTSFPQTSFGSAIDHTCYKKDLFLKEYDPSDYPYFSSLDNQFLRKRVSWTLNSGDRTLLLRPVRTLEELLTFKNMSSNFCFFDSEKNGAQLYLAAAHQFGQLLGIWKAESNTLQPSGIVPLYLMKRKKSIFESGIEGVPFLYVEAPMISEKISGSTVQKENGEETTLENALLDIIAVYAGLQYGEPFPVIGTCRKDDSNYGKIVRTFIETAAHRFETFQQKNNVGTKRIHQQNRLRTVTNPQYEGIHYLELPEDQRLLAYLQGSGYRYETVLMNSQAFLNDNDRGKKVLLGEWGPMRGWTTVVPIPEFINAHWELINHTGRDTYEQNTRRFVTWKVA